MEVENAKVRSLAKALTLLECFSVHEPELGITQIAERLGMNKSNVHSMMSTFQQGGYVERLPNGKYALGLKLLEFSYIINQRLGYPKAVYDLLVDLATKTGEIVYFGLPHGTNVLYLYVAHPIDRMRELPYRDILGEKAPLYCTGLGKAMLSAMDEADWPSHIPEKLTRYTEHTMMDRTLIMEELWKTRRRGYAIDNMERENQVRCVGVPVFSANGQLVAGVSTSGPVDVMTDEKVLLCAKQLTDTALRMKERIYR